MTISKTLWKCLAWTAGCLLAAQAHALDIAVSEGRLITVPRGEVHTVSVADPAVADVQVPSPGTLLVVGKRAGSTTLYALDASGKPLLQQRVTVTHNLAELQTVLRARFPKLRITPSSAPGSLLIDGNVPDAQTAEAVARTVQPYLGDKEQFINRLAVTAPTQVQLRVRFAEVQRNVTQALGVNWDILWSKGGARPGAIGLVTGFGGGSSGTSSGGAQAGFGFASKVWNVNGVIDALDQEGLITLLAEPNLSAVSGQTASFLAGGEFPIPVAQGTGSANAPGTITIAFKPFGVALDFTPTVLSDDRISVKVKPEVSQLDYANGVVLGSGGGAGIESLRIPGLTVRRVETTVEMSSGESFAIGGLLQNNINDMVSRIPGLGRIPILGQLFSSSNYQNGKSELVVIVTPYLVRPASAGALATPHDSMRPATDIEYILRDKIGLDPLLGKIPRLTGAAGFAY
jgi:pilus assembly protein CpaC